MWHRDEPPVAPKTRPPTRSFAGRGTFWLGLLLGGGLTAAAFALPYVNWRSAAAPVDERPLMIRHDAKGDGHFQVPRSGHRHHRGIDLAATLNSPVRAIRSGRVVLVGVHQGFGRFIELEHRGSLRSLYAHLNEVSVDVGAHVRQGQIIGRVGKTGNARSPLIIPHLHLEVLKNGEPIDPTLLGLTVQERAGSSAYAKGHEQDAQDSEDASGGE